jgi:hypothetical protein
MEEAAYRSPSPLFYALNGPLCFIYAAVRNVALRMFKKRDNSTTKLIKIDILYSEGFRGDDIF